MVEVKRVWLCIPVFRGPSYVGLSNIWVMMCGNESTSCLNVPAINKYVTEVTLILVYYRC